MSQQPQNQPSANDVLMGGGGAASAKFDQAGTTIGGRILAEPRVYQEREYDRNNPGNGAPKFYPKSGDPIMSVSVDVQTSARTDSEDDGVRRIYIEGKRLKDAVRDAVRQAGAKGLEVGGELHVTYTGDGDAEKGMNPPKLYTARYVSASSGASGAVLGVQEQAPATPPVATFDPVQASRTGNGFGQMLAATTPQPAAAAQSGGKSSAETAKELIAAGLDDATVSAASGLPVTAVAALRNTLAPA